MYPTISEYLEAIKAAEDNFEQLKNLRPVLDDDGNPVMTGGNFAEVFKMKDEQTGKLYAVKCFLREQEGRAEAYRMIAEELEYVSSTFLTPIKYLDKELFVDTNAGDEKEFPVLLMDWVEGETLDKYIRKHLDDQYELSLIAYQFSRLSMWLMPQPFAHGDLKPDNILVKSDGTLVLVDYDGMYVPAMKGQKARELGSPDFRHPSRTETDFDEHIDDFSLASILLSLKAISLQPSLLEEYGAQDRLLFSEKDYRNLSESKVMDALKSLMQDAELASLYSLFILALSQNNLSQVSFRLFNLSRPEIDTSCNIAYLKKRANQGDADSQYKLGKCYIDGDCVEKNYEEAIKWLNKAANSNHAKALNKLGYYYSRGIGVMKDTDKALSFIRQAELYYDKEDICEVMENKIIVLKDLARYDEVIALLDEYVQPGKGCRKCSLIKTYNKIERCCPWMQFELGSCYFCGQGITENNDQAVEYFTKAAEQGYEKAQSVLGLIYEGCNDYEESIKWYTKAANQGSNDAKIKLFKLYGKKQDFQNAILWLKKAAEKDDIDATYFNFLGLYYEDKKEYQESVKWYTKAARGNDAKSQYKLAVFYALGIGVGEDLNVSNEWLKKAAEQGYEEAIKLLKEYEKEILSTEVTDEDLVNAWVDEFGVKYSADKRRLLCVYDSRNKKVYSIRKGTIVICEYAFHFCFALTSIHIPESVTSIGNHAFQCCYGLTSIHIPFGVTRIEDSVFSGCNALTSIHIPDSVTSIGRCAFSGCDALTSIHIPDNVTSIGDSAFSNCKSLTSIHIPDSVTSIGLGAFGRCKSLTSIRLPFKVLENIYNFIFECTALTSIIVPIGTRKKIEELLPSYYKDKLIEQ